MLTDLGSNCFGDANIGPLCFFVQSFVDFAILGRDALGKKRFRKRVCVSFYGMCGSGNAHPLDHTAKRLKS
jgi:hypothetical protein